MSRPSENVLLLNEALVAFPGLTARYNPPSEDADAEYEVVRGGILTGTPTGWHIQVCLYAGGYAVGHFNDEAGVAKDYGVCSTFRSAVRRLTMTMETEKVTA